MNKKNKRALRVLIVILLITLGVITAYYMIQNNVNVNTTNTVANKKINNTNIMKNTIKNEEKETNIINNTIENVVENVITTNVIEGDSEDNTQKAINIVKKDWGTDESIYFDDAGIDNEGRYVISVHDKDTTETLAWYSVDVRTGQFFKQ